MNAFRFIVAFFIVFPCLAQEKKMIDFGMIKFENIEDFNALIYLGDSLKLAYDSIPFYISNNGGETYWDGLGTIRDIYEKALFLEEVDSVAVQRIAMVDGIFYERQQREMDVQYHQLLLKGDALAKKQNYAAAIKVYQQCLAIKPTESYCKNKILELEKIRNTQRD